MMLSKNLSLLEVTKSNTATRMDIDNRPPKEVIVNLRAIAEDVFQPIRDHFNTPIGISSGYRCKELNRAVRGSRTSQHMSGEALDIDADIMGGLTNAEIFNYIRENLEFDQLIWEFGTDSSPDWVHVSYKAKGDNRKRVLRARKDNKGVYYAPC